MAPKRERGAVREMKQSVAAEMAKVASARAAPWPPPRVAQALFSPSTYATEEKLLHVRRALAAEFLGGEALRIRSGSDLPQGGEVVTFHDFSVMGLLPPFLDFFLAILEAFAVHMLHLHPNAVMILASFAYACKAFVGVMPSVALSRHYFVPQLGKS